MTKHRLRLAMIAAGGAALTGLLAPTSTLAMETDFNLIQSSGGIIAVSCQVPNPVGVEVTPTASSQGVTVPVVYTPPVTVPPVVIGQIQVGPETVGPFQVGGFTVPSQPVGGEQIGGSSQSDEVGGAGGVLCAAVNVTAPTQPTVISGAADLQLWLEELNPNTNQVAYELYSAGTPKNLTSLPVASGVDAATAVLTDTRFGVPAAGQLDPGTGDISLGIAQYYLGVTVSVNGQPQPTGTGCHTGDFSCSLSGTFVVF